MKILQINVTSNTGSTGRIAEQLGSCMQQEDIESFIAFSRKGMPSTSNTIQIGGRLDLYTHVLYSRVFDRHGFASKDTTKKLIAKIQELDPDLIHLHNIHGYYVHIALLFEELRNSGKPVCWTLHDCWAITGHCAHFEDIHCEKWKEHCYACPKKGSYPKSLILDRSYTNYSDKKRIFTSIRNLTIITPSVWLENIVKESFLKEAKLLTIYNGINLEVFKPVVSDDYRKKLNIKNDEKVILGVASIWTKHRGVDDFIRLHAKLLGTNFKIILVGLSKKQLRMLPSTIIGIERTENLDTLVQLYSMASVYINPTYSDNFPTTNIEALACGTPVITYNTGGSPEAVDKTTGIVVNIGDIDGLVVAIQQVLKGIETNENYTSELCRNRAEKLFNMNDRYGDYIKLYKSILSKLT
jgi:glycosyltransferase involved in cell wall biosynthesis